MSYPAENRRMLQISGVGGTANGQQQNRVLPIAPGRMVEIGKFQLIYAKMGGALENIVFRRQL